MKINRDISVLLIAAWPFKNNTFTFCDPLAGSGVRGIRIAKEVPTLSKNSPHMITLGDSNPHAVAAIKKNLSTNRLLFSSFKKTQAHNKTHNQKSEKNKKNEKRILVTCSDANDLLMECRGVHVIDIDPFGSPNPFLDTALRVIARNGLLAITATDTAPLAGTSPKTCMRKYWAVPERSDSMHEYGIRILIRKAQLVAAQYDKALVPILSYWGRHYYRVWFVAKKGRQAADNLLKQHSFVPPSFRNGQPVGPLWTGKLNDEKIIKSMIHLAEAKKASTIISPETTALLHTLLQESRIHTVGIINPNRLGTALKKAIPSFDILKKAVKNAGGRITRSHFLPYAIKTTLSFDQLKKALKNK